MDRRRLAQLLVGHALADGVPVGPVLRNSRGPKARAAAAEVEAGRLRAGLVLADLAPDLADVAEAWPAALRPAQTRLADLPSRRLLQLPLLKTLGYLLLLVTVQAVAMSMIDGKVLPTLIGLLPQNPIEQLALLGVIRGALVVAVLGLPAVIALTLWAPIRLPGVGPHLLRAREAAIAAALVDAGATADVQVRVFGTFRALSPGGATADELTQVVEDSVARARVAHRRIVTAVRTLGLGLLVLGAAAITITIYQFVSWLPS